LQASMGILVSCIA